MIETISKTISKLKNKSEVSVQEYKKSLELAHEILSSNDTEEYNLGLSVICHVATSKPKDLLIQQLLYDCIINSRIFLYSNMLQNSSKEFHSCQFEDIKRFVYTNKKTNTLLTKDQKNLLNIFDINKKLIVSAPTSFGKSRIIPEIINEYEYDNIAIVLPTIALLNETYLSLKKYSFITKKYQIINSLMVPLKDKNIFIFTPEKMDMFLDEKKDINIDFFVMDEIYKIQDDLGRKQIFTHCLYRLSKMNSDFYLIGPYFNKFSESFIEKTNAKFRKYSTEIVKKDVVDISNIQNQSLYNLFGKELKKFLGKDVNLKHILSSFSEQTLIYARQVRTVESLAKRFAESRNIADNNNGLIDYIEESVNKKWSLINCLKKRVAFHHGKIPRYIQVEIVDLFNKGEIDYLFCTSTLIEGVNTSAKNVVIYDTLKGKDEVLTGFDIKNIQGRAGRFLQHFIGNVVILEPSEKASEKDSIEFSYYDEEQLPDDELLQVNKNDLNDKSAERYNEIESQLNLYNIPLSIIKKNKFIDIFKQIKFINYLRSNPKTVKDLFFENNIPDKEQLEKILDILHEYIFNDQDKQDRGFPLFRLKHFSKYYVYKDPLIKDIILQQESQNIDTKIRSTFRLISHYFEFSLPKYLTVFENIYNFVSNEKISLKFLITKLEFGFTDNHEVLLRDIGVPYNIIKNISEHFEDCKNLEELKMKYFFIESKLKILPYEKQIIKRYLL
jgi:ERCC4-related helicase